MTWQMLNKLVQKYDKKTSERPSERSVINNFSTLLVNSDNRVLANLNNNLQFRSYIHTTSYA